MATYSPLSLVPISMLANAGSLLNGGILYFFKSGTSTPQAVYSDNAGTSAGTSVTLDARGEPTTFKVIWLDDAKAYRVRLDDSLGNVIWGPVDNIQAAPNVSLLPRIVASTSDITGNDYTGVNVVKTRGYSSAGDGGAAEYRSTGSTGTASSIAYPYVYDSAGNQFEIVEAAIPNARSAGVLPTNSGSTNTTNILAMIAGMDAGATIRIPAGNYVFDPTTITKSIRIVGDSTRQASTGTRLGAAGAQTHLFMIKGGAGTFPTDFIDGLGFDNVTIFGNNYAISDALLVFWNCGMLNSTGLNVTNAVGSAMRLINAQDMHFNNVHISDIGDNGNQKPVIYCDPSGNNNVNNIYFVDGHYESLGWSLIQSTDATDDQIQFIGGKNENRTNYAGTTATDLTFSMFDIQSTNRFSCHGLTITNAHLYSGATFKCVNASRPQITNINVQNSSNQTSNIVSLTGSTAGFYINGICGGNVGSINNQATQPGQCQKVVLNTNGSNYGNLMPVVGLSTDPDYWRRNAGGEYSIGLSGSLTGRSLKCTTASDAIAALPIPMGYQKPIRVVWRVQSDASITVSMAVRTPDNATSTNIRTGVAVTSGSWQHITMDITPSQMADRDVAVLLKETAGTDALWVDGAWIEPAITEIARAELTVTSSGTEVGEKHNAAMFFLRNNTNAGSAIVISDTNFGIVIVSQAGTSFVTGAPAAGEVQLTQATYGGQKRLAMTSNTSSITVGMQQITVN